MPVPCLKVLAWDSKPFYLKLPAWLGVEAALASWVAMKSGDGYLEVEMASNFRTERVLPVRLGNPRSSEKLHGGQNHQDSAVLSQPSRNNWTTKVHLSDPYLYHDERLLRHGFFVAWT